MLLIQAFGRSMVGIRAFFEDSANEEMRDFESLLPTVRQILCSRRTIYDSAQPMQVKVNDRLSFSLPYLERLVGKWKDAKTENLSWEAFEAGQREHLQALSAVSPVVAASEHVIDWTP